MKYSWLLFDADGTLFDFDKSQQLALEKVFTVQDLQFLPEYHTIYTDVNKMMWEQRELGLIGVDEIKKNRFKNFFNVIGLQGDYHKASRDYLYFLSQGSYLLQGAESLISELHGKCEMVLLTNGLTSVQKPRFEKSPITVYFKHVIISEEVGFQKPQKEIFDLTFDRMHHPPKEEVVMIGDNLGSDILGGVEYGIDTVWFNPGRTDNGKDIHPTYQVSDFRQLKSILYGRK